MSKKKITPKQKEPLMKLISEVIDELPSYENSFQSLVELPKLKQKIRLMFLKELRPFLWEGSGYPAKHKRMPIHKQLAVLADVFGVSTEESQIYYDQVASRKKLPLGADGYFAIPRIEAIAKRHFPEITEPTLRYRAAAVFALRVLQKTRPTDNFSDGFYSIDYVEKHYFAGEQSWHRMSNQYYSSQKGDVVIIPAQLGRAYFKKVRMEDVVKPLYWRLDNQKPKQFPLGLFEAACLLLTHPHRLSPNAGLPMICTDSEMINHYPQYPIFAAEHEDENHPNRIWFQYQVSLSDEKRGYITGFLS